MARKNIKVDFGYEEDVSFKGSIFVLDSFEDSLDRKLEKIINLADDRKFDKLVFYPFHENTLRRMNIDVSNKYFSRLANLEYELNDINTLVPISIDKLDGKRKKYTPIDFVLNHLVENHKQPYFLYVTKEVANKFASYSSFEKWIKEVRLIIEDDAKIKLHEVLEKHSKRIELI